MTAGTAGERAVQTEIGMLERLPMTQAAVAAWLAAPIDLFRYMLLQPADAEWLAVQLCVHAGRTGNWRGLQQHLIHCAAAAKRTPRAWRRSRPGTR